MQTTRSPKATQQCGSALIVGMIFLLVMTMLGVTAMQSTTLEERMAGNMRDRGISIQAAEVALRAGDADAIDSPTTGNGLYDYLASPAPEPTSAASWTASSVRAYTSGIKIIDPNQSASADPNAAFPGLAEEPRYWLEKRPNRAEGGSIEAGVAPVVEVHEVTARSTGASGNATVVLRSTVIN